MFTHPDRIGQLATEHHEDMLAKARQRKLGQQHGRRSARTRAAAVRITRRLATAVVRIGAAAVKSPGAIWAARPQQPGGPAAEPSHQATATDPRAAPDRIRSTP